jgi:hypothetical protein
MPKYRVYEIEEDKVMITGVYKTRAVLRAICDIDFDTLDEAEKKIDSLVIGNYTILPIYHNKNHNLWKTTINKKTTTL